MFSAGFAKTFSQGIVTSFSQGYLCVGVKAIPFLDNCVDVKNSLGLAVNENVFGRGLDRNIDTEAFSIIENSVQDGDIV